MRMNERNNRYMRRVSQLIKLGCAERHYYFERHSSKTNLPLKIPNKNLHDFSELEWERSVIEPIEKIIELENQK